MIRLAVVTLLTLLAAPALGASVHYRVRNHSDGNQIQVGVDEDGYALRLDSGGVHTFNANHGDLFLSFDPAVDPDRAFLQGVLSHNESGTDTTQWDPSDDVYAVSATFSAVQLTDEAGGTPWFGARPDTALYADALQDLLLDANHPDRAAERNKAFSTDVARVYFAVQDLVLTPQSTPGLGNSYTGPLAWDEHGPSFFLQYRWRYWGGAYAGSEFDRLAAAGWLEEAPDQSTPGTQDFLFSLDSQPVPEPGTWLLLAVSLLGLARVRA